MADLALLKSLLMEQTPFFFFRSPLSSLQTLIRIPAVAVLLDLIILFVI